MRSMNKQVIQIAKAATEGGALGPEGASPEGKTVYKPREPSSDEESNTAEAVGNVLRLHSTQQETLCASKNFIGNDYLHQVDVQSE